MADGSVTYKSGEKRKLVGQFPAPQGATVTIVTGPPPSVTPPTFTLFSGGVPVTGFNAIPVDSYSLGSTSLALAVYAPDLTGLAGFFTFLFVAYLQIAGDTNDYRFEATGNLNVLPANE